MKNVQLLSVVLSMVLVFGVSAGTAFAESEDHDEYKDYDKYEEHDDYELDDLLDRFCDLSDEEKRKVISNHPRLSPYADRLLNYCEMSEDEREEIEEMIEEHKDRIRHEIKKYANDYRKDHAHDMRAHLDRYCEMTDEDKKEYIAKHDKAADHVEKMDRYCSLDEDRKRDFISEHREEYKAHMKEKMKDKMHDKMANKKHHMNYDRLCAMSESDRAAEITDVAKLDRISDWCSMTPEQREDYKKKHHDGMKDKMHDKIKAMKLSDKSHRLKAMIMGHADISDERMQEIKMKYREKHGDLDKKHSELKIKFKDHIKKMKYNMSDERRSMIHDRIAEMKAFKAELREKASGMSDEDKQQLREDFIEKAKDLQLAWITPRTQIAAGVDAAEVECREGYSLVLKSSNGVAMCLKADTALKMIDRGIAVPAN